MKGLSACIAGGLLVVSLTAAATSTADDQNGVRFLVPAGAVPVVGPGVAVVPTGTRVYHVSDEPGYDLSGPTETWFLVENGTAFRVPASNALAAHVPAGTSRNVGIIPAEYRQNWLSVAAGDRAVRCITTPTISEAQEMTFVPANMVYFMPGDNGARYSNARFASTNGYHARHVRRAKYHHRRTTSARQVAVRHRAHRRHYTTTASNHRRAPARYTYATAPQPAMMVPAGEVKHMRDEAGRDVYQINNTWYTESGGTWARSDTWRGPFVHVRKGTVPREVREVPEKHRRDWMATEVSVR